MSTNLYKRCLCAGIKVCARSDRSTTVSKRPHFSDCQRVEKRGRDSAQRLWVSPQFSGMIGVALCAGNPSRKMRLGTLTIEEALAHERCTGYRAISSEITASVDSSRVHHLRLLPTISTSSRKHLQGEARKGKQRGCWQPTPKREEKEKLYLPKAWKNPRKEPARRLETAQGSNEPPAQSAPDPLEPTNGRNPKKQRSCERPSEAKPTRPTLGMPPPLPDC
jgi:hypothetical protein